MKREIHLSINAKLLSTNEEALKKVTDLLTELEDKGFLRKGRIIFDSIQDDEVSEIIDRHMSIVPNSKTAIK